MPKTSITRAETKVSLKSLSTSHTQSETSRVISSKRSWVQAARLAMARSRVTSK